MTSGAVQSGNSSPTSRSKEAREQQWHALNLPVGRPYDGAVLDKDGRLVLPWGKPHPADGVRKP